MRKIFYVLIISLGSLKGFSQKVGIGTATPAFKLDVRSGSINTDSLYRINAYPVLSIKGNGNFFAGKNAGFNNTGSFNTTSGDLSLFSNTSGNDNTALGSNALYFNTTCLENTATGSFALNTNTTGRGMPPPATHPCYAILPGRDNAGYGYQSLVSNTTGS